MSLVGIASDEESSYQEIINASTIMAAPNTLLCDSRHKLISCNNRATGAGSLGTDLAKEKKTNFVTQRTTIAEPTLTAQRSTDTDP
jgi:hypothetical protein